MPFISMKNQIVQLQTEVPEDIEPYFRNMKMGCYEHHKGDIGNFTADAKMEPLL
jgi:hypothetical protein